MRGKQKAMIYFFFNYCLISSAGSLLAFKIFTLGKYCHYPLTTKQGDRFASCENIVSRSKIPHPPLEVALLINTRGEECF